MIRVERRTLTLAKGKCAETVVHLMTDQRSVNAVSAAIAYGDGMLSRKQLNDAAFDAAFAAAADDYAFDAAFADADAAAANAAAFDADAYADADAADAAANADAADAAAAYAAADAAFAYAAADAAAADAAFVDARQQNLKQTADICREILTDEILQKLWKP